MAESKPRSHEQFSAEDKGKLKEDFRTAPQLDPEYHQSNHANTPERNGMTPPASVRGEVDQKDWKLQQERLDAQSKASRREAARDIRARRGYGREHTHSR